jgi:ribosomal protein S2
MKLKRYKKSKLLITQLKTFKLSYRKKSYHSRSESRINRTLLNKILQIIYKYDKAGKKILFVGFVKQFDSTLQNAKHVQISEPMLNKIWDQQTKARKTEISKSISKLTLKLKKKADLVIINNPTNKTSVIKQSYLTQIPLIIIGEQQLVHSSRTAYESNCNYDFQIEKNEHTNLFFALANSVLKKSKSG